MSGVEILTTEMQNKRREEALGRGRYLVTERLALTRDGRVLPEDKCVDGGSLLYRIGDEIPLEEARARGIAPAEVKVAAAAAPEVENKTARRRK
jgi:hypothetical protein